MTAAQALEFLKPLRPGRGVGKAWAAVREIVPALVQDRALAPDIRKLEERIRTGAFSDIVRAVR
jgi:histidine ammonia-lyase